MSQATIWLAIGFIGQGLFSCRFLIQWIASAKRKESFFPTAFWWLSIGGGLTLLLYAIWREDPVFIMGQSAGLVIYARNLMLIQNKKSDDLKLAENT